MSAPKPTLDELVREARAERAPDVDWARMEESLLARVAAESRARAAIEAYEGKRRSWVAGAMVLVAAAAAIPLFLSGRHDATLDVTSEAREPAGGELSWKDANARVFVTRAGLGHDAVAGESLARGDVIEPKGGRAVFARGNPGVTWDVEDNARVAVRSTRGPLILALERGAVEAQVAPVADGEAFAIDVEGTRVAVHGTHLRVSREGSRAVVDLREGVISVGAPPREGATYGDLVSAPAHVEFDPADPHATLKVSHEITRVRAAAALEPPRDSRREGRPEVAPPTVSVPRLPTAGPTSVVAARSSPVATSPAPLAAPAASPVAPRAAEPMAPPVPHPPTPGKVDPNPEQTIRDAVRACEATRVAQAAGVVVTIRSTLDLQVGEAGMVESARFDPPLAPEVQQCAARTIYGTRFSKGGALSVGIDFTR